MMELTEKTIKQILKQQREEYQRYTGILAEEFASQVKTIAEILSDVQKQLQNIKEDVANLKEDIAVIRMEISIIRNDLKEKVGREEFKTLEKRLSLVERKLQKSRI